MNALLVSLASVVTVCILLYFFEKFFSRLKETLSDEVVGIYFNFIGVLFTLILAFVVVAAWEDYDNAMHSAENEAHKLLYTYEDAFELSPENRVLVQQKIIDYTHSVINDEWEHMDENHIVKITEKKFHDLVTLKKTLVAHNDEDALKNIAESLDELKTLRHVRESFTDSHVPNLLWAVLLGGFSMCILLSFCINFKSIVWKMIMTSIVTFAMSVVMYLTYCLSNPYKGDMKIGCEDYQKVLILIKQQPVNGTL
jgi:hypothetical protein